MSQRERHSEHRGLGQVKADAATLDIETAPDLTGPDGSLGVASPIQGTISAITVAVGDSVRQGQQVAVVEAMKMEHVIAAPHSGIVRGVTMEAGDVVRELETPVRKR